MKRLRNLIIAASMGMLLTGCGIYNKYNNKVETPADVFGADQGAASGGESVAQMSWREFFSDPLLQQLIEQALASNTDLNSARIAVEKSKAALMAAKLAYLPSLYLAPQGTLAKFDGVRLTTCRCNFRLMSMSLPPLPTRSVPRRPCSCRLRCMKKPCEPI